MKKFLPLVLILGILGGGAYYYQRTQSSNAPQSTLQSLGEASEWAAAVASGKPTLCTMTKGEEKMEYLIKGKKMKATMNTLVADTKTTSYMVNDEKYLYLWQDGQTQGTKMAIPTEEETKKMAEDAQKYVVEKPNTPDFYNESGFDALENGGYTINCSVATASDADFVPPTTITFVDPSALMQKMAPSETSSMPDAKTLEEMAKKYGATMPSEGE